MSPRAMVTMVILVVLSSVAWSSPILEWTTGGPDGAIIQVIVADPTTPGTFYASGLSGLVWRTQDGGVTWQGRGPVTLLPVNWIFIRGLAIDPSDPRRLYAAVWAYPRDRSGVYTSRDSGASWELFRGARFGADAVIVDPGDPLTVTIVSDEGVWRTANRGRSWKWLYSGGRVTDLVMDPTDPEVLYCVTRDDVSSTTDGGETWTRILEGRVEGLAIRPGTGALYAAVVNVGVVESTDDGVTWLPFVPDERNEVTRLVSNLVILGNKIVASSFGDKAVYSSTIDSTRDWRRVSSTYLSSGESLHAAAVDPFDRTGTVLIGSSAGVLRSTDGAATFSLETDGLRGLPVKVSVDHFSGAAYATTGVYQSGGAGIFRSSNGCESWQQLSSGLEGGRWSNAGSVSAGPGSIFVVEGIWNDSAFRGDRTSGHWTTTSACDEQYCTARRILADPCVAETAYVAFTHHEGSLHFVLSKTTDGGASWRHLTEPGINGWPLHTGSITALRAFSSGQGEGSCQSIIYAATGINSASHLSQVMRSSDGGETWSRLAVESSIDHAHERVEKIQVVEQGHLYLGTNGGGGPKLHRSLDGGNTWVELTDSRLPAKYLSSPQLFAFSGAVPGEGFAFAKVSLDSPFRAGLLVTKDGGDTWTRILASGLDRVVGALNSLEVDPTDPERIIVGSASGVFTLNTSIRPRSFSGQD